VLSLTEIMYMMISIWGKMVRNRKAARLGVWKERRRRRRTERREER
jgi:hypothetical protein